MNTPVGIISVIATMPRPESTMQAGTAFASRGGKLLSWRKRAARGFHLGGRLRLAGYFDGPDAFDQAGVFRAVLVAHRLGGLG